MRKYPAYRDSGVEWLGEIPTHWSLSRIKNAIAYAINGIWGNEPKEDGEDIICIRVADFEMERLGVSHNNLTYRCIPIRNDDQRILRKGDLLIEKSGGGEKQPVGRVISYDLNENAVSSNFIAKISPNNDITDSGFLLYSFNVCYSFGINNLSIKQTTGIQNLDTTHYFNNQFCFPPLDEQTRIVSFLKHKTHQIDDLICKKQKLIELLKEERTALINQAVTKGLNTNVPMKDSGIDWLGEIPEHWEVKRLKSFCNIISKGTTPSTEGKGFVEHGIRFIKAENLLNGKLNLSPEFFIDYETDNLLKRSRLNTNDILIVIAGATIGKVAIIDEVLLPANTNQAVCFIRLKELIYLKFLFYVLKSEYIKSVINLYSVQSAQPNLAMGVLGNFNIPTPGKDEINAIVTFIEKNEKLVDNSILRIQYEIDLFSEYKTSLINETVTGKIDVRDYQINHA